MDPGTRRRLAVLAVLAVVGGAGLLSYAVWTGQAEVGLLLVFPFVIGEGPVALAGTGLLFVGFAALMFSWMLGPLGPTGAAREGRPAGPRRPGEGETTDAGSRVEGGGGGIVMIGPIPIVFGSDARWATLAGLAGLLVLAGLILLFLLV